MRKSEKFKTLTSNIRILDDNPYPEFKTRELRRTFEAMKVGQSFYVDDYLIKTCKSLTYKMNKQKGKKFSVRMLPDTGEYYCWRIE